MLEEIQKNNARARFIGDRELFPDSIRPVIEKIESESFHNTGLQVNLLFCYGGQQEIIAGVKSLIKKIKSGELKEDEITEKQLEKELWMGSFPAPDMILRTSGIKRLSNFLTFQGAYSELHFIDCMWPDINEKHLEAAIEYFDKTKRNFGI